jgi:hypothetical protein
MVGLGARVGDGDGVAAAVGVEVGSGVTPGDVVDGLGPTTTVMPASSSWLAPPQSPSV